MAVLNKARKEDLVNVATELGEEVPPDSTVVDLRKIILESANFEEQFIRDFLATVMEDRKKREAAEKLQAEKRETAEKLQAEREHEYRLKQLELQASNGKESAVGGEVNEGLERPGSNFLGYLNLMKGVIPEPPRKAEEWPSFFQHAERMFEMYEVPEQYQGKLIVHALKGRAKGLGSVWKGNNADKYENIKEIVLKEYRITPLQHKSNFDSCRKRPDESYMQYTARVVAALDLYLEAREVSDFEKLKDLLVADKVKEGLVSSIKSHVHLKESEGWLSVEGLASELDNFVSANPRMSTEIPRNGTYFPVDKRRMNDSSKRLPLETKGEGDKRRISPERNLENKAGKGGNSVKCFRCHESGHVRRFCPQVSRASQISHPGKEDSPEAKALNKVNAQLRDIPEGAREGELPSAGFCIDNVRFKGIIDSGAEITVLRRSLVPERHLESGGKIAIRPAIGPEVQAELISVPIALWTGKDELRPHVKILAAVVDNLNEVALVTPQDFRLLSQQKNLYLGDETGRKFLGEKRAGTNALEIGEKGGNAADPPTVNLQGEQQICEIPLGQVKDLLGDGRTESEKGGDPPLSQAQKFKMEQTGCESLSNAFADAKKGKNGYWLHEGVLYHTARIGGQKYSQLVIPTGRRNSILRLAHEMPTGGHLAAKKTKERVSISFWWEGLAKDVKQFCESCQDCQLRRRVKVTDRAPIEAVGRPELPFQVVNADIFGPIEPKSARGHQYVLVVMDQHSRWPEAVPLKSLTAKSTCEAFMEIFMRTGVPRLIAMDNGTNFNSKLTKEFLSCLGIAPRFSTPGYPQANGLVERFVGTMKSMLHHAIRTQGKGWDKQLPYLLWAYREVPNSTTGVPPFMLLYGRLPTGPLAILRTSWEDEGVLPQGVGDSVTDYLQSLREKLKIAEGFAREEAVKQQERYVHHHNLRSSDRRFEVGDEVVVLIPDSTNKLCSRWRGPGEIVGVQSPHSFLVKLPDGSTRHLHQNRLRKYVQPANAVGVIYEDDGEFGEVLPAPVGKRKGCEEWIVKTGQGGTWDHLNESQKNQLIALIKDFHPVFDGEVKRANVGSHVIKLKPGVERKQPHIYKVPESIKPHVEKQIADLLQRGLIETSVAEVAYPIVCVAKKDGTVRLCCDYRGLNAESQTVPFPMQNSEELRFRAGAANFLTTLDILKGYWEIPLDEECKGLTSFVSPKGQYQWTVMPFGLSGAAATFQRTMNQALRPHSGYAESFIDDIIIYSQTWEEHLGHIRAVLDTLRICNFSANLEKCAFAKSQVKYLGHVVGSGKHGPDPDKIAVIRNLKVPKTKKALRSVLGLINYYREYVSGYANIARPLTQLTRKSVPNDIPWGVEADKAFSDLKDALCQAVSLYTPDLSKPFEIHTDASLTGIGACLVQRDEKGNARPITFASQKLTSAQMKWSTIEREAYAVIWALGKFETWTYGLPILLHTDHNPLKFLTEGIPKNARLQRWALALPRYNVSVAHKPGSQNADADALSRLYSDD